MNKLKNIQSSHLWKKQTDWLHLSRSFSLYANIDLIRAVEILQAHQSRNRLFLLETKTQADGTYFYARVSGSRRGDSWIEGWIQPIENMKRLHIQGRLYHSINDPIAITATVPVLPFMSFGILNLIGIQSTLIMSISIAAAVVWSFAEWRDWFRSRNRMVREIKASFH